LGPTYVLEGVDALGGLLDLTADDLWDELVGQLLQGAAAGLTGDDLGHLSSDGTDLGRSSVGGLLDLVGSALGESNGEQAEEVVVGGLDRDIGLDQGLPLADERPQLVGCEVEAVEVGQAVLALNLVDAELDLAESVVLILLQVGEGDLDDAALQGVVGVLETGGPVDKSLADTVAGAVRSSSSPRGAVAIRVSDCLLSDVERRRSLFASVCQSGCPFPVAIGAFWTRTLMPYQSLREKGSTVFFLRPFLPLDNLLFLSNYTHQRTVRLRRHCVRFWQLCIVAMTGEIDVLANSHLCEVRISKTGNGSLGGWNWEIARFGILGGDRRQIDKANFLGGAGLVARAPRKKEGPISGERALSEYVSIPNMHLNPSSFLEYP
jgi:hypothetical protein